MNACTIIARNYLPHARVLAESFLAHHPHGTFTALVIDDPGNGDLAGEPFAVLSPYDIGLERDEVHRMAFIYDVKEFATSVKPALLSHLLKTADDVAYFDPDIEVFAALDDIGELARAHGIVLTPHTTTPLPRDELLPSEEMLLKAGIYNLGFIAVGQRALPFLDWWGQRLRRDCLVAVEDGVFVDQRWVDFVPALFEHVIARDTTCNVAYWNLSYRELTRNGEGWEVDGRPLRFFHYSGFSPDRMNLLSAHMGSTPRILLADQPELRVLCDAYADSLRKHGFGAVADEGYRFDMLPNGLAIDGRVRRDVRQALLTAERAAEPAPPDPFDATSVDGFLDWLGEPVGAAEIPRYLDAIYRRRGDLRHTFPDVTGSDHSRYLEWASSVSRDDGDVPRAVLERAFPHEATNAGRAEDSLRAIAQRHRWLAPVAGGYRWLRARARRIARAFAAPSTPPPVIAVSSFPPLPGVNLAGYLRAELGVGEAARRLARGLAAGHIPHATTAYGRTESRQQHPYAEHGRVAYFDTNVVCVNADELPRFRAEVGAAFFSGRYTIGMWFWEVSRFPQRLHGSFELVDEIWVASEYVADALRAETSKPVRVIPLPVEAPRANHLTRGDVGLPDGFVFLYSFDFLSVVERKNPMGLVDAFERAFPPGEGPTLVIKTINGPKRPDELALLERRTAHRDDILLVDGYISHRERDALTALCDCYVSLHRSEGYGLTLAEAMAMGKPVIATGYSGNLAFMDEENCLLVPYRTVRVPPGCEPYPVDAEWADPDLDVAARYLRDVWEAPDVARQLGARAREQILDRCSPERTAEFVAMRLDELRDVRRERSAKALEQLVPGAPLIDPGGRWPARAVRRLLQRLLWPYLAEQLAFDAALADALRAQSMRSTVAAAIWNDEGELLPHERASAHSSAEATEMRRTA